MRRRIAGIFILLVVLAGCGDDSGDDSVEPSYTQAPHYTVDSVASNVDDGGYMEKKPTFGDRWVWCLTERTGSENAVVGFRSCDWVDYHNRYGDSGFPQ